MKIKLSKSQWEEMGRKAGWMDAYKSVRKPALPTSRVMDDGNTKKELKDIGGDMDIPTIEELENEAKVACEIRGHQLGEWEVFSRGGRNYANNKCMTCGKEVQVIDRPMPNEIDVGGEAVALNCE